VKEVRARRRDPRAARAALRKAGAELFSEHGFESTTLDAIAARSGLNKAMVRYYFGNKLGLYTAVFEEAIDFVERRLDRIDTSKPAPERLDAQVDALAEGFQRRPQLVAMLVRDHCAGGARLAREELSRRLAAFFQKSRAILESGKAESTLRAEDPHEVHLILVGALIYFQISSGFRQRKDLSTVAASAPTPASFQATFKRILKHGLLTA